MTFQFILNYSRGCYGLSSACYSPSSATIFKLKIFHISTAAPIFCLSGVLAVTLAVSNLDFSYFHATFGWPAFGFSGLRAT